MHSAEDTEDTQQMPKTCKIPPKMGTFCDGMDNEGPRRRFCGHWPSKEGKQRQRRGRRMAREYSVEGMRMNQGMMEGEGREEEAEEAEEDDGRGRRGGRHCARCQWDGEMRGRAIDRCESIPIGFLISQLPWISHYH